MGIQASKKTADLSSALVALKGKAAPASDSVGRQPEAKASGVRSGAPLNFKVDPDFRRRFRQRAADYRGRAFHVKIIPARITDYDGKDKELYFLPVSQQLAGNSIAKIPRPDGSRTSILW